VYLGVNDAGGRKGQSKNSTEEADDSDDANLLDTYGSSSKAYKFSPNGNRQLLLPTRRYDSLVPPGAERRPPHSAHGAVADASRTISPSLSSTGQREDSTRGKKRDSSGIEVAAQDCTTGGQSSSSNAHRGDARSFPPGPVSNTPAEGVLDGEFKKYEVGPTEELAEAPVAKRIAGEKGALGQVLCQPRPLSS
jgi:hypothetical protein